MREYTRVLKEQLEAKCGLQLAPGDVITAWMVRWSAMVYSRFALGRDGLTAYERRRGRRCRIPMMSFGEKVWFNELRLEKNRQDKFLGEWREGIWLGHTRSSNEQIVGTELGVTKAYSINRQEESQR